MPYRGCDYVSCWWYKEATNGVWEPYVVVEPVVRATEAGVGHPTSEVQSCTEKAAKQ